MRIRVAEALPPAAAWGRRTILPLSWIRPEAGASELMAFPSPFRQFGIVVTLPLGVEGGFDFSRETVQGPSQFLLGDSHGGPWGKAHAPK
jgi:hypothetical protein